VAGQVLPGDLVLALPFGETDQVQVAGVDVVADIGGEPLGHREHQRRGRELIPAVIAEEPVDTLPVLQPRLAEGQQHAVDAADLQRHPPRRDRHQPAASAGRNNRSVLPARSTVISTAPTGT
jgi:hypothetical protein